MSTESLREASHQLAAAVDGVDWSLDAVKRAKGAISAALEGASGAARDEALEILVARLERASVDDADGVAHVAIYAGVLVEKGASATKLGHVLLDKLPSVLVAARRFADACLRDVPPPNDDDPADAKELLHVDGRAIPHEVFGAHKSSDPSGAAALARLKQWVLPNVACLTRHRALLERATKDAELRRVAAAMRRSDARWLHVLLGVLLGAEAIVLDPASGRGFRMVLDGIVSNFDLRALVEDALLERGLPGTRNPPDVLAVVRGDADTASRTYVTGAFNLYTYRGAQFDVGSPKDIPLVDWIWNEGVPDDVPRIDGKLVVLVGRQGPRRTWDLGRSFSALRARVDVAEELAKGEVDAWLARCRAAAEDAV
ncbi:MAG TPA: hypothetical protein VMJ10_18850 [Kofleriaceae bacterium]|nr:hypothetical protein [Kofleriaceae bacterium]